MRPILIGKHVHMHTDRRRRGLLAGLAAWGLTGCALPRQSALERLLDLRSGRDITPDDLLQQIRTARFVLLGEQHDNPAHHARRADLLRRLAGSGGVVVAEHLTRGRQAAAEGALLPALQAAGFDPRGWQWPLHEALFAAARDAGLPILGGNLPAAEARRIAREGEAALPPELARLLAGAPLSGPAQARLDADLLAGHCGQLPAARLPAMRLAQRARDAAMALALRERGGHPAGGPTLLLAGNGHVRQDYGLPPLLAHLEPGATTLAVVFGEPGQQPADVPGTHLWITAAPQRSDPCAGFDSMRRPAEPERGRAR